MNLEIRHLKLVKEVAASGSLTRAAEKLFVSQSALSHQLKDIEVRLEVQLFHRIKKKMVLTPAGNRVLTAAHIVLSELIDAESDIQQAISGKKGRLRITTECYTCYHWLPGLLKSYHTVCPDIEVEIVTKATRKPLSYLQKGKLDLALISGNTPTKYVDFEPLFSDELILVVHKNHPLADRTYLRPKDFADVHLLMYKADTQNSYFFQQILNPAGIRPRKTSKMQLTEAIIEMVKADLGVSVMASWAAKPYLTAPELVAVPITDKGLPRTWYAATLHQEPVPQYLKSFVEHFKAHPIQ